jgi:two-component system, chemotaxis family, response regulator Rcp1
MGYRSIVLLVDDSPADATLVREALKARALAVLLYVVPNGHAALAFLRQEGVYSAAPRPDLMLLDLNLPGIDGHSVLAAVRRDPAFLYLPVVIFSSSSHQADIDQSYTLGANGHMRKPVGLEEFFQVVKTMVEQWARGYEPPAAPGH